MKSAALDKDTVDAMQYLYNRKVLFEILYLEDQKYEEKAFEAFSAFERNFSDILLRLQMTNATLSFTTKVVVGDEMDTQNMVTSKEPEYEEIRELHRRKAFYQECLGKIPENRVEEMFDHLIERLEKSVKLYESRIVFIQKEIFV